MFFKRFASNLRIELNELKHAHSLELAEKDAAFQREKKVWEEDRERLKKELESEHALKLKEILVLTRLESEQKIKQAELNSQRQIDAIKNENIKEMAAMKEKLVKEHYEQLTESMTKLHEEGNNATKFTQELALKMFDAAPKHTVRTENITGQLAIEQGE